MMTIPGLALFYGGLVRRKNVLSTLMQASFSLASSQSNGCCSDTASHLRPAMRFIGGLAWLGLSGVSASEPFAGYSPTVPHQAYMIYQCMFAIITPALITGAIAERMSFRGFLMFTVLWSILIYNPLAHWVWGVDGWLHQLGALDFAGGTVVHISSGTAALAAALVPRQADGIPARAYAAA